MFEMREQLVSPHAVGPTSPNGPCRAAGASARSIPSGPREADRRSSINFFPTPPSGIDPGHLLDPPDRPTRPHAAGRPPYGSRPRNTPAPRPILDIQVSLPHRADHGKRSPTVGYHRLGLSGRRSPRLARAARVTPLEATRAPSEPRSTRRSSMPAVGKSKGLGSTSRDSGLPILSILSTTSPKTIRRVSASATIE